MATLTVPQILALGRKGGFTDAELPDFVAVVLTESGGRTDARQAGGLGRGLVQIDLGQHPGVTEAQAYDPAFAVSFARRLSRNRHGLGASNWYGPRDHPAAAEQARAEARKFLAAGDEKAPSVLESIGTLLTTFDPGEAAGAVGNIAGAPVKAAGGFIADQLADAIRALVPWGLVRRLLMVGAGAGIVVVGAGALGVDVLRPVAATAKRAAKVRR